MYAKAKGEERSSGQGSTMNPQAVEFKPEAAAAAPLQIPVFQQLRKRLFGIPYAAATPTAGNPDEQPPEQSTMNRNAEEFIPKEGKETTAVTANPTEGNPDKQLAEDQVDFLQQHQQRHEMKRNMNKGRTRQKNKALTRRQRRNDARGYVPEPARS